MQFVNSDSCLDHILVKTELCTKDIATFVLNTPITDHIPTGIIIPHFKENFTRLTSNDKNDQKGFINY